MDHYDWTMLSMQKLLLLSMLMQELLLLLLLLLLLALGFAVTRHGRAHPILAIPVPAHA